MDAFVTGIRHDNRQTIMGLLYSFPVRSVLMFWIKDVQKFDVTLHSYALSKCLYLLNGLQDLRNCLF